MADRNRPYAEPGGGVIPNVKRVSRRSGSAYGNRNPNVPRTESTRLQIVATGRRGKVGSRVPL